MMRRLVPLAIFVVALFCAGVAWFAGFATAVVLKPPVATAPANVDAPANFGLFNEAWGVINREFYGQRPPVKAVADGAVTGLVAALGDDYAAFMSPEAVAKDPAPFAPRLVNSLGVWVEPVANGAVVLAVVPDSPAARATQAPAEGETTGSPAILPGDHILAAGQQPLAGVDELDMLAALGGEQLDGGSEAESSPTATASTDSDPGRAGLPAAVDSQAAKAQLVLQRGDGQPIGVEISRGSIQAAPLSLTRSSSESVVIRPNQLVGDTVAQLDQALAGLRDEPAQALVLDLRDNPGGDTAAALAVAGRFMSGDAWIKVAKDGQPTPLQANSVGAPDYPKPQRLVVLVNGGTAGAAEQLAAALHEGAGARIVGQPTFGKAAVQNVHKLADGSLLRLTVGTWQSAGGLSVADGGLKPDLAVDGAEAQLAAALAAATGATTAGG